MRAAALDAVSSSAVTVTLDAVSSGTPPVAMIVQGRIGGLPGFIDDEGAPRLDASGVPISVGAHEAPFRMVIPEGQGDYPR